MKKVTIIFITLMFLFAAYYTCTGFVKREDVYLTDFTVHNDGDGERIKLQCAVPTSVGYLRKMEVDGGGVKSLYLSFYSTFGGINSSIGSQEYFILDVMDYDNEIYFSRPGGGYELVLERDSETGEWQRPTK